MVHNTLLDSFLIFRFVVAVVVVSLFRPFSFFFFYFFRRIRASKQRVLFLLALPLVGWAETEMVALIRIRLEGNNSLDAGWKMRTTPHGWLCGQQYLRHVWQACWFFCLFNFNARGFFRMVYEFIYWKVEVRYLIDWMIFPMFETDSRTFLWHGE